MLALNLAEPPKRSEQPRGKGSSAVDGQHKSTNIDGALTGKTVGSLLSSETLGSNPSSSSCDCVLLRSSASSSSLLRHSVSAVGTQLCACCCFSLPEKGAILISSKLCLSHAHDQRSLDHNKHPELGLSQLLILGCQVLCWCRLRNRFSMPFDDVFKHLLLR